VKKILQDVLLSYDKSFEIIEAQDGIDILKHVMEDQKNRNLIKCVFTDECMEYMNGSQAIEIIRIMEQQNKIKKVNIICVTSYEDKYNRELILKKGADYIMEKPCSNYAITKLLSDLNLL
jgi:CheY-like chemotaxis protein